MRVRSFEELMLLPEELAVARHFDGVTWQRARWFLGGYLFAAFVAAIVFAATGGGFRFWVALADLVLLAGFLLVRKARAARAGDAREVRSHLLEDVAHFKGQTIQGDDISLVVVRYQG